MFSSRRATLRPFAVLLSGLAIGLALAGPAMANGGTVRVSNQRTGPYDVTVFTDPTPPRIGVLDVSVAVQRAGTGEVVGDARVTVSGSPVGAAASGALAATHEQATNKLFYAANVPVAAAGRWHFDVRAESALGDGAVAFEVEVEDANLLANQAPLLVLAVPPLALAAWWALRRRGRGRPVA